MAALVAPDAEVTHFGPPPVVENDEHAVEPSFSARPTRRDLVVPDAPARSRTRSIPPRGEFSISSVRGVPADVVSGSIERPRRDTNQPRRRRSSTMPVESVHLASATKREITVVINDQTLTLARHDALALAQIILTAFD
jgi:hypothetical protein